MPDKRPLTYRESINEALKQEMMRDKSVFVYGIDVQDHKRILGTTNDLVELFGEDRCFSTPLCEDTMTGFGLGAAVNGLRPVHVHIRVDFLLLAMNQIANMVSSFCYGSKSEMPVPMVIRVLIGRGWGQAYQHSKTLHSFFAHLPGLKVVMPVTPYEVKGMLIGAIRDNNPVVFMEHRWLYDIVGDVPEENYELPLNRSVVLDSGSDISIVATSWMVVEAAKAAEIMRKRGVSVEVVNVCSISHFDVDVIMESVRKTKNCIVADNDWLKSGFSAELVATIYEQGVYDLRSPVSRIGFEFTPCPCTRPLENEFYPNAINIIREIEHKLNLSETDLSGEDFYSYENKFRGPF